MKDWGSSKYIGVTQQKRKLKNGFIIRYNARFKNRYLGTFKNEIDAAIAYDDEARTQLGDKAKKVNFKEKDQYKISFELSPGPNETFTIIENKTLWTQKQKQEFTDTQEYQRLIRKIASKYSVKELKNTVNSSIYSW